MAYVKHLAIRSSTHISNVVAYNTKENKTNDNLITGVNCDYTKVKEEFQLAKLIHDKDDCKVIAHQYFQSFKGHEITPKLANEIGVRLADEIAPGYQALVVTHVDTNNIHNHILINSVNVQTGYMYKANKDSLEFVRNKSDQIINEYGLSIIKEKSGLKGIDQSTYRLAEQGKSWKIKMLNSIDEAISFSRSKDEFIKYMNDLGYEIKWQNKNISFRDPNEQIKFIRAKTLASQFGKLYSKEGIENRIEGTIEKFESNRHDKNNRELNKYNWRNEQYVNGNEKNSRSDFGSHKRNTGKSEYDRYEQWKREHEDKFKEISIIDRKYYNLGKIADVLDLNKSKNKNKDEAKEETMKILLFISLLIVNRSYKSIKSKKDKSKKYRIKDVKIKQKIGNVTYDEINKMPGNNKFIKLNVSELEKLKDIKIKYTGYIKDNSIIITTKEDDFTLLLDHIGRKYEKQFGTVTYKYIKSISEKIEYRIIDEKLLDELKKNKFKFASFKTKDQKYNISFDSKESEIYKNIIDKFKNINKDILR